MPDRYYVDERGSVLPLSYCRDIADVVVVKNPPVLVSDDVEVELVEIGDGFTRWEIRVGDFDLVGDDLATED